MMGLTMSLIFFLLTGAVSGGEAATAYESWYMWDWKHDFAKNIEQELPVNPVADAQGSTEVWRYTYNTNDATSAGVRNVGRLDMELAVDNGITGVWARDSSSWGSSAYVRGDAQFGFMVYCSRCRCSWKGEAGTISMDFSD